MASKLLNPSTTKLTFTLTIPPEKEKTPEVVTSGGPGGCNPPAGMTHYRVLSRHPQVKSARRRVTLPRPCVFRSKSTTDSTASRSLIPRQADQRFHGKPITDSTASRSLLTGAVESLRSSF